MRRGERKSQLRCHRHQPPACRGLMAPYLAPAPALSPGLRHIHWMSTVWSQKPALLGSAQPSQIPLCQSQTQSLCNRVMWFGHYILRNCTLVQFYLNTPYLHKFKVIAVIGQSSKPACKELPTFQGLPICLHRLTFS